MGSGLVGTSPELSPLFLAQGAGKVNNFVGDSSCFRISPQAKKLKQHNAHAWLLNTGWIGGSYGMGEGRRIPLKYTRLMVNAIHDGTLLDTDYQVSWQPPLVAVIDQEKCRHLLTAPCVLLFLSGFPRVQNMPIFNLAVPTSVKGVPSDMLLPQSCWADRNKLEKQVNKLAALFIDNFSNYTDRAPSEVVSAGPVL